MFECEVDAHCDFLGPGYRCRDRDDIDGNRVGVCIGG